MKSLLLAAASVLFLFGCCGCRAIITVEPTHDRVWKPVNPNGPALVAEIEQPPPEP